MLGIEGRHCPGGYGDQISGVERRDRPSGAVHAAALLE